MASSSSRYQSLSCILVVLLGLLVLQASAVCPGSKVQVAQSIPVDLPSPPNPWISTFQAWETIISKATKSIDIACYYMTLTDGKQFPPQQGGYMGQEIFDGIVDAALKRGVEVRIVQQVPTPRMPAFDTANLTKMGVAKVRSIDFQNLMKGIGGILHTKMIIVDGIHAYVGSANLDWRSLSQVKEVGIIVQDCPEYALDMGKIFEEYWIGADSSSLPAWPPALGTSYTLKTPMKIESQGSSEPLSVYIASSPQEFAPGGRVNDLDSILDIINTATTSLKFSIMDYIPTSMYLKQGYYWPVIDDALRAAAYRGVRVQCLFSIWNSTNPKELQYWKSLNALDNAEVRTIRIPDSPYTPPAPFSRVSHSKYIVSDNKAYVTTSNCGADYFLYTGGVSVSFLGKSHITAALSTVFDGDWSSSMTTPVPDRLPPRRRD